uniref:R3H domain-containing protein n=1 Tax=Steinernema glaseri TaxID=37863 RepID=A0A1I8AWJ7_9BILA
MCHAGPCKECENLIHRECHCGSENQILPCSAENVKLDMKFSCGKPCQGTFACGVHACDRKCHKASSESHHCGTCKFDPQRLSSCPCGKQGISDLLEEPREKCTDPVPTCPNRCLKILPCSLAGEGIISGRCHRCDSPCHTGECPPCKAESTVTCRCRAVTKDIPCEECCSFNASNPFLCDRRCRKNLSCLKHKCQDRCCTQNEHLCLMVCGKKLDCGLHSCERLCHMGKCHKCLEASFEEQYCMCGRTVRMPPIPCGAPLPLCNYPCTRPHPCGHPQFHTCHSEEQCPPCTALTSKYCFGEHEIRNNVPCHQNHVCCGKPCDKMLACGVHKCKRTCHPGECARPGEVCRQPCSIVRKNQACEHICGLPCHGMTPCKQSDCLKKMVIRCPCGRLTAESRCFDIEREYKRMVAIKMMDSAEQGSLPEEEGSAEIDQKYITLQCDSECKKILRNRKIFEALELDKQQIYNEFLMEQVNRDDQFVKSVEKVFNDIVSSAQRSKNVDKMSYVFHALSADRRKVIHEYAPHFRIETKSSGVGPQRNTTVSARYTSGYPSVYLSSFHGKKCCFEKQAEAKPVSDDGIRKLNSNRPVVAQPPQVLIPVQRPSTSRHIPRSISLTANASSSVSFKKVGSPVGPCDALLQVPPNFPPTFVARFHKEEAVRRMVYRKLGATDLLVSQVGLGCGPIGGLFGNVDDSITSIIETALQHGVNLIDTAYWYGQGRSEEILGKVLSKVPRQSFYISTKVGRFELDFSRTFDFRADKILESLTNSLKKLRLSYVDICFVQVGRPRQRQILVQRLDSRQPCLDIDLLQLHDSEFSANENIILYETLPALEMAKHSGKIRHIGVCGYPLAHLASIVAKSTVPISVVMTYCHAALNDNALGEYLHFFQVPRPSESCSSVFQSRNVGLVNAASLSMGLLTGEGPPPWHPASENIKETARAAVQYCQSKNISIEKLAIEYGMTFPGVSTCLVGMDSVERVLANIELCSSGLSELELRVRDRIMRRYFDRLENANWEGVDVRSYWKRLKKLGLSALATHRHSSVESLTSTLTSFSRSSSRF